MAFEIKHLDRDRFLHDYVISNNSLRPGSKDENFYSQPTHIKLFWPQKRNIVGILGK